jgi:mRNA interferase RelE/StbE
VLWVYRFDDRALKELRRLDSKAQEQILRYCEKRLVGKIAPRGFGHSLTGQFRGLWGYRVGDHRLICDIKDGELIILVLAVGHQSEIYR